MYRRGVLGVRHGEEELEKMTALNERRIIFRSIAAIRFLGVYYCYR